MTDRELMQQAIDFICSVMVHPSQIAARDAIADALEKRLAQLEQGPVAWLSRDDARLALWEAINKREFGNPTDDKLILDHLHQQGLWIGKYTTPPRQWQGLTDDEIVLICGECAASHADDIRYARAIEAKLKEKNT